MLHVSYKPNAIFTITFLACIEPLFVFAVTLPKEIEQEIQNMYSSLCEVLRHFWSCFPTTTPALEEKAKNSYQTLKRFEKTKIAQVKDRLIRDHLDSSKLLSHATSIITAADNKYNQCLLRNTNRR